MPLESERQYCISIDAFLLDHFHLVMGVGMIMEEIKLPILKTMDNMGMDVGMGITHLGWDLTCLVNLAKILVKENLIVLLCNIEISILITK